MTAKGIITYLQLRYENIEPYSEEWVNELIEDTEFCGAMGAYRACFLYPSENVAIKVPRSRTGLACCENEFRLYEEVKKAGLEVFFAKPLKRIEICHGINAYVFEYVAGAQPIDYHLFDYIEERLRRKKNKERKQVYKKLEIFLESHNIRDLHDENWVLTSYRLPKILDYGWF